jgi:hypothetical protein
MAQPIELSGEANPLSLHNVQNALALAASSTQQQIQTGAQQLQNWEKQEMYYTFLQVLWPLISSDCSFEDADTYRIPF